jgi:hypothetical protein
LPPRAGSGRGDVARHPGKRERAEAQDERRIRDVVAPPNQVEQAADHAQELADAKAAMALLARGAEQQ